MAVKSPVSRLHYGYIALAVASLALLSSLGFGRFVYSLILPGMKDGLSLNYTQMGLLGTAGLLGYLVAVPVAGALAAHYGSRLVMAVSMAITGAALLATGASPAFEWALLFQTVAGVASGAAIIPSMAAGGIWAAPHKRGIASGCVIAGVGLFFFGSGPVIPALVASSADSGWRLAWYASGGFVLAAGLVVAGFMRNRPQDLGLHVLGYAPEKALPVQPTSALSWGLVYKSGAVWHLAAIYAIFGFSYVSYLTFFAAFLRQQGGLTDSIIGNMWAISGAGLVIGALFWGALSDRLGRRVSLALVFLVLGASILLFTVSDSVLVYTLSAVLFWAAEPGVPVIVAASCGAYVGGRLAPAAMGFTSLFMGVGQAIGPAVAGSMADATASFNSSFHVAAAAAGIGIVAALLLRQPRVQF